MKPLTRSVLGSLVLGEWRTPNEICRYVHDREGELHSDSSITARLRELRNRHGMNVVKRKRLGSRAYEYAIREVG